MLPPPNTLRTFPPPPLQTVAYLPPQFWLFNPGLAGVRSPVLLVNLKTDPGKSQSQGRPGDQETGGVWGLLSSDVPSGDDASLPNWALTVGVSSSV